MKAGPLLVQAWIAPSPQASAASRTASEKVGWAWQVQREVLRRGAEFHRDADLVDQVARGGADDVGAEDAVGLLVGEDLDEAVALEDAPWRGRCP